MSPLQVLLEIGGPAAVRDHIQTGLDDLEVAEGMLDMSLAEHSLHGYRQFLHHVQNTAGEMGLDGLVAAVQSERSRVVDAGGVLDDRFRAQLRQAETDLRAYLA